MKNGLFWLGLPGILLVGLILSVVFLSWEGTAYLAFGWIVFPFQMWQRVTVDRAAVVIGCVALVLFVVGFHAIARGLLRSSGVGWKLRWSLTCTALVVLAFASGVALIGMVHQVGWLATAHEPMFVASLRSSTSALNLRMLHLGLTPDSLPQGGNFAADGQALHSWESAIIQSGQTGYYDKIDKDKPWNEPGNQETFKKVCPLFLNPELRGAPFKDADRYGLSHYAANSRVMAGNYAASKKEFEGHTSTTLVIGEVNAHFKPWGCPINWRDPALGLNRSRNGFGGRLGGGGVNFLMADGSVRFLSDRTSSDVLRSLSSPQAKDKGDDEP